MSPRAVSTRLDGVQPAARLPEPVTVGRREQPAFSTPGQQDRPSLTTPAPGARSRFAILSTSFSRKPLTTLGRSRSGLRSAVVSTLAEPPRAHRRLRRRGGRRLRGLERAPGRTGAAPLADQLSLAARVRHHFVGPV